jgi:hypothetical protein
LFFLGITLCLVSCSQMKYTSPDAPDWAVGLLKTDKPDVVRIFSVDGKAATGLLKGQPVTEFPDTLNLFPGFHNVVPCFISPGGEIYGNIISFYSQETKVYIIRHKVKWDKSIKFWVECDGVDITKE